VIIARFGLFTEYGYADPAVVVDANPRQFAHRSADELEVGQKLRIPAGGFGTKNVSVPGRPGDTPGAKPQPGKTPKPGESQSPRASPSRGGMPWGWLILGSAVAVLVGAIVGWRNRGAIKDFFAGGRKVLTGWTAPLSPRWFSGLLVTAGVGAGAAVGLVAFSSGVGPSVAGAVAASLSVLASLRALWSPIQARAPTVVAVGRAIRVDWPMQWTVGYWSAALRAWAGQLRHNTKLVVKLAFTPVRAVQKVLVAGGRAVVRQRNVVGAVVAGVGLWVLGSGTAVTVSDAVIAVAALLAGVRPVGVRNRLSGEHRYYPTWLQEMLEQLHPGLGAWFYEFLHLKLKRQAPKSNVRGFKARLAWFAKWLRGLRAKVAAMVYNRAYIAGYRWQRKVLVWEIPVWHGAAMFRIVVTLSDLGQLVVLDQQKLGGETKSLSRTLGAFPVIRIAFHFAVPALGRFDLSLVHFFVPGKKLERTFGAARLAGWQRFNLPRRFWRWVRAHDLAFWTWKPFAYITQTQLVVGVGPFGEDHYNYSEYRFSIQGLDVHRDGKPVKSFHFIQGPARQIGRVVFALGRFIRRVARAALPGWVRRPAGAVWGWVWRTSLTERRAASTERLRLRVLRQLDKTIHAQRARLDAIEAELAVIEHQIADRIFKNRAIDPVLTWLFWRRDRLRRARAGLIAALAINYDGRHKHGGPKPPGGWGGRALSAVVVVPGGFGGGLPEAVGRVLEIAAQVGVVAVGVVVAGMVVRALVGGQTIRAPTWLFAPLLWFGSARRATGRALLAHDAAVRLDPHGTARGPQRFEGVHNGGTGDGGAVAIGGLSERQRLLLVQVLRLLAPYLRPLQELTDRMPRGPSGAPPVLVLDVNPDRVGSALAAAGFTEAEIAEAVDALRWLVMFGWREIPTTALDVLPKELRAEAAGGVAVITRAMLDELLEHRAADRLTAAELEDLSTWLRNHEGRFHINGAEHSGPRHDVDAARLVNLILQARARLELADPAVVPATELWHGTLRHLRAVAAVLADHPVLQALGATPISATGDRPDAAYGEYFGNPDFRASEQDRRRYLANPPVSASQDARVHRAVDQLGGLANRIPRADLHAVLVYLSALYAEPNAALRSGDAEQIARYETFIRVAVSGFNQLGTGEHITSYRGIELSQDDIARLPRTYPVRTLVVDPGFASTEVPDPAPGAADPTDGLRTSYYDASPVVIEIRSRTGRDSWPLMRVIAGTRYQELTFIPGSTFLVRELRVNRDAAGIYWAHMVWEDVSHLRPSGGPSLQQFHAELIGDLATLREWIARGEQLTDQPPCTAGIPLAEAREALELTERLLAVRFAEQYTTGGASAPTQDCATCGASLEPTDRFCEACGGERPGGAARPMGGSEGVQNSGTGGGGGGLVAVGPHEPARAVMVDNAATLDSAAGPLDRQRFEHLPRGPPADPRDPTGPEVEVRVVPAQLRPTAAEGVIAFGWKRGGVVLVFEDALVAIDALIAAGRLPADWWVRLLVHERDFHLLGDEHTGRHHDLDADPIAHDLLAARTASGGLELHPLRDVEFVRTLAWDKSVRGRDKIMLLWDKAERRYLVAKHWESEPDALVSSVTTALLYWMVGALVPRSWLAIATEDVREGNSPRGKRMIAAGELVEVLGYLDMHEAIAYEALTVDQLAQLADRYGITGLLGDPDGVKRANLKQDDEDWLWQIDFDEALRERGTPLEVFVMTLLANDTGVFGLLTERAILTQFDWLVSIREQLLAAVPSGPRHRILTERLDRMAGVVADQRLPQPLRQALASAQQILLDKNLGQPTHDRPTIGPEVRPAPWRGPTRPSKQATAAQLLALARADRQVWVHAHHRDTDGEGLWEITLHPADERFLDTLPTAAPTTTGADIDQIGELLDAAEQALEPAGFAMARRDPQLPELLATVERQLDQVAGLLEAGRGTSLSDPDYDYALERLTELGNGWFTVRTAAGLDPADPAATARIAKTLTQLDEPTAPGRPRPDDGRASIDAVIGTGGTVGVLGLLAVLTTPATALVVGGVVAVAAGVSKLVRYLRRQEAPPALFRGLRTEQAHERQVDAVWQRLAPGVSGAETLAGRTVARAVGRAAARVTATVGAATTILLLLADPAHATTAVGFGVAEGLAVAGGGLLVLAGVGLVVLVRWRAVVKRERARAERERGWSAVPRAGPLVAGTPVAPSHVLQWTLRALLDVRGGGPGLARLSAYLAGLPDRAAADRLVADLVDARLVRIEQRPDGAVLVLDGVFQQMWARAPPVLRLAMARNLAEVLGDADLARRSAKELADAVRGVLREAIGGRADVRPRWRTVLLPRLPRWLRGRGELKKMFAGVRPISRQIDELASSLRTPRRRLEVAERLRDRLVEAGRVRDDALRTLSVAEQIVQQAPTLERGEEVVAAQRLLELAERALAGVLRRMPRDLRGMGRYGVLGELEERIDGLRRQIRDLKTAIAAKQDEERAAVLAASDQAALAGFGRKDTARVRDAEVLGWARFMAPLAGTMGAFPGQAAGAPSIASTEFADYYGRSPGWVSTQSAQGASVASGVSLGAALLGDRLIKNMVVVASMGVAGSAALLVLGMVPAAVVFFPSVVVVGSMGVAGGLVRGRMDRYHPVALELKDPRDASYETWFKATQFVLPLLIGQGIPVVGFQATMLGLAVLGAALTFGAWLVLRGEGRDAMPRAPPNVSSSIFGALLQFVGTPHGLVRAVLSIPLLTALTGLYMTALGSGMIDQLVLVNDPTQAVGDTAAVVSVLVTVRGLATMLTGPSWPNLKVLLGSRGAIAKALGRDVEPEPVREARVLVGVTLLPVVLAVPAVWMALVPGLWPFAAMLTMGAVVASWARMPLNRWVEGPTGASLNNTAKAATIALGGAISAALLGDYSTLVGERAAADLSYTDLVSSANLLLALLVVPVVVVPAVLAALTAKLRIGTLDELRTALEDGGVDHAAAAGIAGKLSARGLNDIGSARALFLHDAWTPRWGRGWRLAAREARRSSVGLATNEHAHLIVALESFSRQKANGDSASGGHLRKAVARFRAGCLVLNWRIYDTGMRLLLVLPRLTLRVAVVLGVVAVVLLATALVAAAAGRPAEIGSSGSSSAVTAEMVISAASTRGDSGLAGEGWAVGEWLGPHLAISVAAIAVLAVVGYVIWRHGPPWRRASTAAANTDVVIRRATRGDVAAVVRLRRQRQEWLAARGSDQWSGGLSLKAFRRRVKDSVRAGETWVATTSTGEVIGTIAVDHTAADQGLWTAEELNTAVIVHRMIVSLDAAGRGIGAALLAHAEQRALATGREWIRLDAWTTNVELHQLYLRHGFRHVRTVTGLATPSAALFERPVGTQPPYTPPPGPSRDGPDDGENGTAEFHTEPARQAIRPPRSLGRAVAQRVGVVVLLTVLAWIALTLADVAWVDLGAAAMPREQLLATLAGVDLALVRIDLTEHPEVSLTEVELGDEPVEGQRVVAVGLPGIELPIDSGTWDNRVQSGRRPVVSGGRVAHSRWGATPGAGRWDLVIDDNPWHAHGSSGGAIMVRAGKRGRLVGVHHGGAVTVVDADGTEVTVALAVRITVVRAWLAASWHGDPAATGADPLAGAVAPTAASRPASWADDPVLRAAAERDLDEADQLLDRASALTDADLTPIAELIRQAATAAARAEAYTRRNPEAAAARIAEIDRRAAEATDRLFVRLARIAAGHPSPSVDLVETLLVLAERLPTLTARAAAWEQRRLFDQMLGVFAVLVPQLLVHPADARHLLALSELIDDAFDTVIVTSGEAGEVPERWCGVIALAAAEWQLGKIEPLIARATRLGLDRALRDQLANTVAEVLADVELLTLHDPALIADRARTLQQWLADAGHNRGPPEGGPGLPPGGAVAVDRATGDGLRLGQERNRRVRRALRTLPHREVPAAHPAYRLVDPNQVWAGHRPALYAVTGLNRELRNEPFAVVLFVAPDPHARGRPAVFVDAEVLARLPLLSDEQRGLLANRELARLRGAAEDAVQAMPLPPAAALMALVRPELGFGQVTGPLSELERRRLALLFARGLGQSGRSGGTVVLDWSDWQRELGRLGLTRLRDELISFTVIDVYGRRWTVMFRHTRAELDALIRGRFLPADFDQFLDTATEADPTRRALIVAQVLNARIRRAEIARARQLDRTEAAVLGSLRALLAQVAGNPGVTLDQLRTTVLPGPVEHTHAVTELLAEFGLIRVGHGSFGPVQRVTALLGLLDSRAEITDETLRALLDEVAALLASRPALWDEPITARARQLLALLTTLSELGLAAPGPDTYLDALHTLAATPAGIGIDRATGLDDAVLATLRTARLVTLAGRDADIYRVRLAVRRLLGDLANPGEIDEPDYQRELAPLAELLARTPIDGDGAAAELAAVVARLRDTEGSPLHPDADRGAPWKPGPTSYGALLLTIRDRPGINSIDLATTLGVPERYARTSARRLARLGLIQITHRAVGGEYYLLRAGAAEQITALENPNQATGAYRTALLDLAELLMREQPHRPSLRTLAAAVQTLRGMDDSPLEATAHVDDLHEPPVVSFLDLLVAIGVAPGSGSRELARLLGTSPEFVGAETVFRLVPGLVRRTRRVMQWRGHTTVMPPLDSQWVSDPEDASPYRTKFVYQLTELGELLPAALRDPTAALPDPRDRAALHRVGLLLRRNPGRDRIDWTALIDAIAQMLTPVESVEIQPLTRESTLRATLDAVAAADGFVTADELAGSEDRVVRLRLARLAEWGLLELEHAADHTPRYRMPDHTRQLLHDLDYRVTILDPRYQRALEVLAGWLEQPVGLHINAPATRSIAAALQVIRDLPDGPLPPLRTRQVRLRQMIDMIGAAGREGVTAADLVNATSVGWRAVFSRLWMLYNLGLVDREIDWRAAVLGRRYRYFPPEHTRRLLADVDNRVTQPNPEYLVLLDELAGWLDRAVNLDRSARTRRIAALIAEIRAISDSPLPAVSGVPAYSRSVSFMLDLLKRDGELLVVDIASASPKVSTTIVGTRAATLFAWELLGRRIVRIGANRNPRFVYFLPDHTRQLLDDLNHRGDQPDRDYAAALERLADWLYQPLTLQPGEQTDQLGDLVAEIRGMSASPLPADTRAPMTSYRGALDVIGEAGADGVTDEQLVSLTGIKNGPIRTRLRLLLWWGLVERVPGVGPRRIYRLPEHTRRQLLALDHPAEFSTLKRSQRLLGELATLLNTPVDDLGPGGRAVVTAALRAVKGMGYSPLAGVRIGDVSDSIWDTLIVLDVPDGLTVTELMAEIGLAEHLVRRRLNTLSGWGLVAQIRIGAVTRYTVPGHTHRLLADLAAVADIADPDYRAAARALISLLRRSEALWPDQPVTGDVLNAFLAVRATRDNPLVGWRPHIPADLAWATLEAIAALPHGPFTAEQANDAIGLLTLRVTHTRLHTLASWGLLHKHRGPRGVRLYTVPVATRLLLAALADPGRIEDEAYKEAVLALAPLLARTRNLRRDSRTGQPLARAVEMLFELPGSPLAAAGVPVPADSLWGTLCGLAAAARPVTVEWLADQLHVSEPGLTGRLVLLRRWGLVRAAVDWGEPGTPARAVYTLTELGVRLLAELADPAAVADSAGEPYRAAVEQLAELFVISTNAETAVIRDVIVAEVSAILVVPRGPLGDLHRRAAPDSLWASLAEFDEAPDGLTVNQLAQRLGLHSITARLRLAAFVDWGLAVRERATDSRDYVYRLAEGVDRLLEELNQPETHHGARKPLGVLALLLEGTERLAPESPMTGKTGAAVWAVRDMTDSPLPARDLHVQANSVLALLGALLRAPDGLTLDELAAALPGVEVPTVQRRLPVLVEIGFVWQARDTRPDGNPRDLVYRLSTPMRRLVRALHTVPLQPTGPREQARRDLALALNQPSVLRSGERATVEIEIAFDAVQAAPGRRFFPRGVPAAPNSVRGTLVALAAAGGDGLAAAELAELAGIAKASMLKRLRGLVALELIAQVPGRRAGAGSRAVVYVLIDGVPDLLTSLDATPLHPRTAQERALRALVNVFNRSISLEPGTEGIKAATAAVAAVRATRAGPPSTASEAVDGYREILASLTGDPESRREQLRTLLDAGADDIAAYLAAIREELAALPPVTAVTELISAAEALQTRYEQLRDATDDHG
jgi:GNAT superfamily N-acetyltransferase/DNA-binding HxlR family transcriptional regulator/predicted transcriptional regulator